jgi:hypothetical protein
MMKAALCVIQSRCGLTRPGSRTAEDVLEAALIRAARFLPRGVFF